MIRQPGITLIALVTLVSFSTPGPAGAAIAPSVKVEVSGVTGPLKSNVLLSLSLADKARRKKATEEEIRLMHARAEGEIKRALQPFGYYRPLIQSELLTGKSWTARYEIEPGPPMLLDSVRVTVIGEGAKDAKFQKLIQAFPLHKGDVLHHPAYDAGKASFERAAAEGGFLDATFLSSRIEVDLESHTSSIVIDFDSGPRHYFGDVAFDRDILEYGTLVRFVNFRRGDAFDFRRLLQLQTDLSGTGYFTKVEVKPAGELTDHRTVPIDVSLLAARKLRFTGGVGYGTDDGARARLLAEMRRLNRRGHRARLEIQYGLRDKRAGLQYFIPWPNPRTDVLTISSGYQDIRTVTAKSRVMLAGLSESRLLGKWRVDPALNYRRENFEVGVDRGIVRTLVPEGTWGRIRSDDPVLTRNGDRLRLNTRGARKGFLSDVSFLQARADGKLIHPLGPQSRGVARLELGATQTGDFRRLPPSFRFFAGGTNSVRGYSYNSLGSRDELRHVIGGRYLIATSIELNHFFLSRWGAAVFADAGNATNSLGLNLKKGVGVGARWVSRAGLLRADVAWGLDRAGIPIEVHFAMGTEL